MVIDMAQTSQLATPHANGVGSDRSIGAPGAAKRSPAKAASTKKGKTTPKGRAGRTPSTRHGESSPASANGRLIRWVDAPAALWQFHLPHIDLITPARTVAAHAAQAAQSRLPTPKRLAYYSALGAAAALGALEWPVAAAIGVGVWVATRTRKTEKQAEKGASKGQTAAGNRATRSPSPRPRSMKPE